MVPREESFTHSGAFNQSPCWNCRKRLNYRAHLLSPTFARSVLSASTAAAYASFLWDSLDGAAGVAGAGALAEVAASLSTFALSLPRPSWGRTSRLARAHSASRRRSRQRSNLGRRKRFVLPLDHSSRAPSPFICSEVSK